MNLESLQAYSTRNSQYPVPKEFKEWDENEIAQCTYCLDGFYPSEERFERCFREGDRLFGVCPDCEVEN